jgi:hypothetical protein
MMDAALARRIAELIRAYQTGAAPHDWQRELACRFDALPVYSDLGGALLLRPDGEVLSVGWDDDDARPPKSPWHLIALAGAAEGFPELRGVLPSRPADAVSCPQCRGAGLERWEVESGKGVTFCGKCGGLGWLSEGSG